MRITRHQMFMDIAETVAKRATCLRGNVGAVIVKEKNIISIGYNGALPGEPHCSVELCDMDKACHRASHAEYNAIERAELENGMGVNYGCTMYCTVEPCFGCAVKISESNIHQIYFRYSYRLHEGLDWLIKKGILVRQVLPNGSVIDPHTKKIIE